MEEHDLISYFNTLECMITDRKHRKFLENTVSEGFETFKFGRIQSEDTKVRLDLILFFHPDGKINTSESYFFYVPGNDDYHPSDRVIQQYLSLDNLNDGLKSFGSSNIEFYDVQYPVSGII